MKNFLYISLFLFASFNGDAKNKTALPWLTMDNVQDFFFSIYYVSTTGSDAAAGSIGAPWLTLAHAEAVASTAGDVVMINNGTYAGITSTHSGSSGNQITFQAVNPGSVNISSTINVSGSYRTFSGMVFTNISPAAFSVTADHNVFNNITINISSFGTGYGFRIGADANVGGSAADNNIIDGLRLVCSSAAGQTIHAVILGGGGDGNIVRNSYISNAYYGVVDKCNTNSQVYNNVINNSAANLNTCIYAKAATGGQYYNNVLRATGSGSCLLMNQTDGASLPSPNAATSIVIKNNIFIKNNSDPAIFNASTINTFGSDYNVFTYTSGVLILNQGATNYTTLPVWKGTGQDAHSIAATASFTNSGGTAITDYQPVSGSQTINAGTTISGRTTDAAGASLVNTPDIGAYEFQSATSGNVYYVSTTGSDANPGTILLPFRTLQKISTLSLNPGDIVYIRAGTYAGGSAGNSPQYSWLINAKNGNASNPITIAAYPGDFPSGGRVIFNCSDYVGTANHIGIWIQNSSYLLIRGIRVTNIPQTTLGQVCIGWWVNGNAGGNITLENCESDHIGNTGFRLDNTNNATFLNCDAHHIDNPADPAVQHHGGSDGFGRYDPGNTSTNTLYKGCRAWFCSDDGWDAFGSPGTITYDGCWAFWTGYVQDVFPLTHTQGSDTWGDGNGFKMGGNTTPQDYTNTKRLVKNCFSFENFKNGYDQNLANVKMEWYNNTAYKCGVGFFTYTQTPSPITVKNNIAYQCPTPQNFGSAVTHSGNSWNGMTPGTGDFASLTNTGVNGSRQADGSLPTVPFMRLVATSQFIDAGGTTVPSRPFFGNALDDGAFEFGGTLPTNQPPIANAGPAQTITLPTSTATLSGSGTDADGTITSYSWIKQSGPAGGTISNALIASPTLSALQAGPYVYQLTVTDNSGATGTNTVKITVVAAAAVNPVADAGINQTITLPKDSVTLDGTGSLDPDGSISSYAWVNLSGGSSTIVSPTGSTTKVRGLTAGIWQFKLTVTDNTAHTNSDTVTITVNAQAVNIPPKVNAGPNQTITLPTTSITLISEIEFADTTITAYKWRRSSFAPTGSVTTSTDSIVSPVDSITDVVNLSPGSYVYELKVTDANSLFVFAYVNIDVLDPDNLPAPPVIINKVFGIKKSF